MKRSSRAAAAFSLVEVTFALGVAAFCLIAVMGVLPVGLKVQQASVQQTTTNEIISEIAVDLRAAVRLPPGQVSKQFGLKGYWATVGTPDWLYFTNEGEQSSGSVVNQATVPTDAAFVAIINYRLPPTDTTSLADIVVSWPAAAVDPATGTGTPAGSVETFVAINRK
jgi:hypothetical protein